MRSLNKRLQKLEMVLARRAVGDDDWAGMAFLREQILHLAEAWGESRVAEMEAQLDSLGPLGLWREVCRSVLADHGFVQTGHESLAETMARALDINTDELRVCIAQGQIGSAWLERFRGSIPSANTN
jgi:hypothetical protein